LLKGQLVFEKDFEIQFTPLVFQQKIVSFNIVLTKRKLIKIFILLRVN